ncbi:MAG: bifunctional DNA-formamidopyrimidine glycosylase/DNA-(apurinic or apyrimidinic site) lyase [Planctomycetota bacterium]
MPELPEVETLRRSLEPDLLNATVRRVRVYRRDVVVAPGDPMGGFSRQRAAIKPTRLGRGDLLTDQTVRSIRRHGKQLAVVSDAGRALLVHLGMTGQVLVQPPGGSLPDHAHVVWSVDTAAGPKRLVFRDPRRFGGLWVVPTVDALKERWRGLGPDALGVQPPDLAARLAATRRPLKAALLDQTVIAGLGNIYVDEACHAAHLRPDRRTDTLCRGDVARLVTEIHAVLAIAIGLGGSTLRDYRNAHGHPGDATRRHAVYGRAGEPCPACGQPLSSEILAGRTTVWCARCAR